MIIRSDPDGADVWINRSEKPNGQTTHEEEFGQHGTFAIRLEKDGYLPLSGQARVPTPWYSYPILDFITEVLLPFKIRDYHEFDFKLVPEPAPRPWEEVEEEVIRHREAVLGRADEMRRDVMGKQAATPEEPGRSEPADGDEKP